MFGRQALWLGWAEENRRPGLAGGGGEGVAGGRKTRLSHGRRSLSGSALAEASATRSVSAGPDGRRAGRGPEGAAEPTQPPGSDPPGPARSSSDHFPGRGTAERGGLDSAVSVPSSQGAKSSRLYFV